MQVQLARIRDACIQSDGGVHAVTVPACHAIRLFQTTVLELHSTGFVPVMMDRDNVRDLPSYLHGRHVLMICADAAGRDAAIAWTRRLALISPRRHVVVLFQEPRLPVPAQPGPGRPTDPSVVARVARADRWNRRGRLQMADRWLLAASLAARRRGDEPTAVELELDRARHLVDRHCLADAEALLRPALVSTNLCWSHYGTAASAWMDVLMARGEFARARAWLASVHAEAAMRGDGLPARMRSRQAELRFWEGRPQLPAGKDDEPDGLGFGALGEWHAGNLPGAALIAARLREQALTGNPVAGWWAKLTSVMFGSGAGEVQLHQRVQALSALAQAQPRVRLRQLARLIAARALVEQGQHDQARIELSAVTGAGPESVAAERLRASFGAASSLESRHSRRQGATLPGIEFLGGRSRPMELVNGLSGLLSIVEDSEDDGAVLAGGCKWVCRQTGAKTVAVVSADGNTLVAAEGWKRSDLGGEIAAVLADAAARPRDRTPDINADAPAVLVVPVRYSGITIGSILAKVRPGEHAALRQALQAFAALSGSALRARLDAMAAPARSRDLIPEIVGDSPLMHAVREAIARAATTPFPVLIEGESGTGKELVARALHRLGPRRDRRLCAVNCAALSDDLVEAELFGHTRGAFTGAVGPRTGLFEEASGGTLFFDEVAELSPRAQAKLLRALQEREIRRVGENAARAVDIRVIAATNANLADAAAAGRFRDDLRFRLAVVRIRLPPLRERLEDVASLAQAFWRRVGAEAGTRAVLGPDAVAALGRYAWPGNVRELQNVISNLVVSAPARGRVAARHVDQVLSHAASPPSDHPVVRLEAARRTFERRVVAAALVRHAGRRVAAASELGLTRQGLSKALRRLGLAADEDAAGLSARGEESAGVA